MSWVSKTEMGGITSDGADAHLRVGHCPKRMCFESHVCHLTTKDSAGVAADKVRRNTLGLVTEQDLPHFRMRTIRTHQEVHSRARSILKGHIHNIPHRLEAFRKLVIADIDTCGEPLAKLMAQQTLDRCWWGAEEEVAGVAVEEGDALGDFFCGIGVAPGSVDLSPELRRDEGFDDLVAPVDHEADGTRDCLYERETVTEDRRGKCVTNVVELVLSFVDCDLESFLHVMVSLGSGGDGVLHVLP